MRARYMGGGKERGKGGEWGGEVAEGCQGRRGKVLWVF